MPTVRNANSVRCNGYRSNEEKNTEQINFRISKERKETLKKNATSRGVTITELINSGIDIAITENYVMKQRTTIMVENQARIEKLLNAIESEEPKGELVKIVSEILEGEKRAWLV